MLKNKKVNKLNFLFDGKCPLCLREVKFLMKKDRYQCIKFIDISKPEYSSKNFKDISYEEAMLNLHGILEDGSIIKGLDVLIYSYTLVGMGWIYAPVRLPFLYPLLGGIYKIWAKNRLKITGRENSINLCNSQTGDFS